jgi:hypothetical protein
LFCELVSDCFVEEEGEEKGRVTIICGCEMKWTGITIHYGCEMKWTGITIHYGCEISGQE